MKVQFCVRWVFLQPVKPIGGRVHVKWEGPSQSKHRVTKMADDDGGEHVVASDLRSVRQFILCAEQRDKVQFVRQRSSKGFATAG